MKKPNSGTLSKNDKKEAPNHPDFKGKLNIEGVEYWISGWQKTSDYGEFISLSLKKKEESKKPPIQQVNEPDLSDEIPF